MGYKLYRVSIKEDCRTYIGSDDDLDNLKLSALRDIAERSNPGVHVYFICDDVKVLMTVTCAYEAYTYNICQANGYVELWESELLYDSDGSWQGIRTNRIH